MAEEAGSQPSSLLLLPQQQEYSQSIPEHLLYKNRLQEYAQKANIPLPVYRTINNGGASQAPRFTSTVEIDGETYTSMDTLTNRKAAEQDAAKHALEGISKKIKNCISKKTTEGGFPPIFQDKVFCKSILHEFAVKMNIEKPKYDTVKSEGLIPVFISTLEFRGVRYVGEASVNKKEAEQLAARAVILSILATEEGMHLSEIIKSKAKLFSAVHEHIHSNADTCVTSLQPNFRIALGPSAIQGDAEGTCQAGEIVKVAELAVPDQSSKKEDNADQASNTLGNVVELALPEQSSEKEKVTDQSSNGIGNVLLNVLQGQSHILPRHEFRKPVLETYTEPVPPTIEFISSLGERTPLDASDSVGKRKSRKKKKANKKAKTEIQASLASSNPENLLG
ncbi:uncharacterized protein LOC110720324 isoform X2 [Chenopodium quinoa]|uniref:uncharacterized protein LOC110720324 isoform X2 n=1 Tax=Chenopodium quinoa TaxID=63459 RepID=UPI000B78D43B|nr:uncharacterized protein LOC110720324 isoform X2 [Chenopodium quinoa]